MKERPILFSGPMVCAILEGRKTQTRRVVTAANSTVDGWNWNRTRFATLNLADPKLAEDDSYRKCCGCFKYATSTSDDDPSIGHRIRSRWEVGDRLWARETWTGTWVPGTLNRVHLHYAADGSERTAEADLGYVLPRAAANPSRWVTPLFIPRWASRITLEITDVRAQRVQEISEEDAMAEGIHKFHSLRMYGYDPKGTPGAMVGDTAKDAFRLLWDSINGKTHPWASHDWVWVLTFKVQP